MTERTNQQWLIVARPEGMIQPTDFEWRETAVPPLADGQVLVRSIYLSLDPTNRSWMNDAPTYLPALELGDVMRGHAIGVVEESRHPKLKVGDINLVVGVASAHRTEGFAACQYILDQFKRRLPTLKTETYQDGSIRVSHPGKES